ncbi:hypothetical protein [Thermofilum pendens]|uniref:hypothetical protein n=1 Tax=Thermofilum pendens TaxID=2269 RepID=UPI0011E5703A|nr:hypothetical protein [Thermofilum pendens]
MSRLRSAGVCYPHVVVNPYVYYDWEQWLKKCRPEGVLVDTGVHKVFKESGGFEYPSGFEYGYARFISRVHAQARVEEFYYVIPDYPSDYPGMEQFYPLNVEKTLESIKRWLTRVDSLPGTAVAVVQGKKDDPLSPVRVYSENRELYDEFELVALGPTCASNRWGVLAKMILAFDSVTAKPFHVFGPSLRAVARVAGRTRRFFSFDSSAMYRWCENSWCSDIEERAEAIRAYISRYEEIARRWGSQPSILSFF